MSYLIVPIAKDGTRKVGLKIHVDYISKSIISQGVGHKESNKSVDNSNPFSQFLPICDALRRNIDYPMELTDGYDIQDKNVLIDYSQEPPQITFEGRDGQLIAEDKILKYKKSDGVYEYKIESIKEETDEYIRAITQKGYRQFKKDRVVERIGF